MKNKSITISSRALIITVIAVTTVIIGVCAAVLILSENKTAPDGEPLAKTENINPDIDPAAGIWDGQQPEDKVNGEQPGIKIPGYPSISIPKNTENVSVALLNPEGNPCYFEFELILKDSGETLYTSKLVPPGQAITKIALARALPEGSYPATIRISTVSLADGTAMNGANVETVLIAK